MTALTTRQLDQGFDSFIQEEVTLINTLNESRIRQVMDYSKQFLDKVFPLAKGNHKNVKSYVVYYQHLLAFFEDGSQSGLKYPKQFVALSGHRECPTSLVLKNEEGFHVELIINKKGKRGAKDNAHIDDIQIETSNMSINGFSAANDESNAPNKHWFSMVRGDSEIVTDKNGDQQCRCLETKKVFTSKEGDDYSIG